MHLRRRAQERKPRLHRPRHSAERHPTPLHASTSCALAKAIRASVGCDVVLSVHRHKTVDFEDATSFRRPASRKIGWLCAHSELLMRHRTSVNGQLVLFSGVSLQTMDSDLL